MRAITAIALFFLAIGSRSVVASVADKAFVGVFEGTGRACSGALHVRAKTIEWNSTYSTCKSTRYEVLEQEVSDGQQRVVFRLKNRNKQCRFEVVEVERVGDYNWNISGYPTQEGFEKRNLSDWKNSSLPERQTLSCPMTK